ncbi:hypothetical protein NDN17_19540 [Shewanella algae]|uniref:hypothetical protein n=1 Tax=Shewanella algae TaxID=38313 RepID=UPI002034F48C|nr:hypothetical protein [Shewanella algae]MCM2530689.1 hypothetical protein [Shewanella algae]
MKKTLTVTALTAVALTGCVSTSDPAPAPATKFVKLISSPALGTISTRYLGDDLTKQFSGFEAETLTVNAVADASTIRVEPVTFCRTSPTSKEWKSYGRISTYLKKFDGSLGTPGDTLLHKPGSNSYCLPGTMGMGCFDSNEIDVTYNPKDVCVSYNDFQRVLSYTGRSGDTLTFSYREFSKGMARSAFDASFQMDLSQGNTVRYKGAELEILKATNTEIQYKVISNFNASNL